MPLIINGQGSGIDEIGYGESGQILASQGEGLPPMWEDPTDAVSKAVITMTGNTTEISLANQSEWYQVTTFGDDKLSRGSFVADSANNRIVIEAPFVGTVEVEFVGSFICDTNNQVIEIAASPDGGVTIVTPVLQRTVGVGSDVGNAGMQSIGNIDISADTYSTLWVRNTSSGGTSVTLKEFYMEAKES